MAEKRKAAKERPHVEIVDPDDGEDTAPSDVYELRVCHGCEQFLPLDAPGNVVTVWGEEEVVCDDCLETGNYCVED